MASRLLWSTVFGDVFSNLNYLLMKILNVFYDLLSLLMSSLIYVIWWSSVLGDILSIYVICWKISWQAVFYDQLHLVMSSLINQQFLLIFDLLSMVISSQLYVFCFKKNLTSCLLWSTVIGDDEARLPSLLIRAILRRA